MTVYCKYSNKQENYKMANLTKEQQIKIITKTLNNMSEDTRNRFFVKFVDQQLWQKDKSVNMVLSRYIDKMVEETA